MDVVFLYYQKLKSQALRVANKGARPSTQITRATQRIRRQADKRCNQNCEILLLHGSIHSGDSMNKPKAPRDADKHHSNKQHARNQQAERRRAQTRRAVAVAEMLLSRQPHILHGARADAVDKILIRPDAGRRVPRAPAVGVTKS